MQTDIFSSVLQAVRLSGAIFWDYDITGPWATETPRGEQIARLLMPRAQNVIQYHVVTDGTCWAGLVGEPEPPVQLDAGTVLVFPHGDAHYMLTTPDLEPVPADFEPYRHLDDTITLPVKMVADGGGGKDRVSLICGYLGCDIRPFNPLITALLRMMCVTGGYGADDGGLRHLIHATRTEGRQHRVGSDSVQARLSELIFIEALRRYVESSGPSQGDWFSALADPPVGRAIGLLHRQPAQAWTLAELARQAGVSRTVLAERFSSHLGMAPMTYLAKWRMQIAAGMLATGKATLAQIANEVGYESEAAFSRAFKRCNGLSPAMWRSRHGAATA